MFGWCSLNFFVFRWVSFKVRQSLPEFLSGFGVAFNGEKTVSGYWGTTWSFPRSETSSNSASSLVIFSTSKGGEDGADKLPVNEVSGNSMTELSGNANEGANC